MPFPLDANENGQKIGAGTAHLRAQSLAGTGLELDLSKIRVGILVWFAQLLLEQD